MILSTRGRDVMEDMSASAAVAPSPVLGAFSAELRKAVSFRAITLTLLCGAVVLLAGAVFALVQARAFAAQGRADALGGLALSDIPMLLLHYGQVVPILLGAWVTGQDVPVGPRQAAFLATARRRTVIGVKLVTAAVVALFAGIVCTLAVLAPLAVAGVTVSLGPFGWLLGYWTVIAVITAALVGGLRSITFTVVPILIWTLGVSDLLTVEFPALAGSLDQVFRFAYLGGGGMPSASAAAAAVLQFTAAVLLGTVLYTRRDVR